MPPDMPLDSYPNMDPQDESTQRFIEDRLNLAKAQHNRVAGEEASRQAVPRPIGGPEALPDNKAEQEWNNKRNQGKQFGGSPSGSSGGSVAEDTGPQGTLYDSPGGGRKPSAADQFNQYADIGEEMSHLTPRSEALAKADPSVGNLLGKAAAQNKTDLQAAQSPPAEIVGHNKITKQNYTQEEMDHLAETNPEEYHRALVGGLDAKVHQMAALAEAHGLKIGTPHGSAPAVSEARPARPAAQQSSNRSGGGGVSSAAPPPSRAAITQDHSAPGGGADAGVAPPIVGRGVQAIQGAGKAAEDRFGKTTARSVPEGPSDPIQRQLDQLSGYPAGAASVGEEVVNTIKHPWDNIVAPVLNSKNPVEAGLKIVEMTPPGALAGAIGRAGGARQANIDDSINAQTRPRSLQKQVDQEYGKNLSKSGIEGVMAASAGRAMKGRSPIEDPMQQKIQNGIIQSGIDEANSPKALSAPKVDLARQANRPGMGQFGDDAAAVNAAKAQASKGTKAAASPAASKPAASKPAGNPDLARQANRVQQGDNNFFGKDFSAPKPKQSGGPLTPSTSTGQGVASIPQPKVVGARVVEPAKPAALPAGKVSSPSALPGRGGSSAPNPDLPRAANRTGPQPEGSSPPVKSLPSPEMRQVQKASNIKDVLQNSPLSKKRRRK